MKQVKNIRQPELESEIKSTVHGIMQKIMSEKMGAITSREAARFHFGVYHHQFQALIDKVSTVLQLKSGGFTANRSLEYIVKRQETCKEIIRTGSERLVDLTGFLRESAALPSGKRKFMQAFLIVLASADSAINTGVLEAMLGMSYIASLLTSLAMAGAFAFCAHSFIPKFWDNPDRARRQVVSVIAATLIFGVLGYARVEYGDFPVGSSPLINVLGYTFLSLLFFFAACGIGVSLHKSRSKRKDAEIERAEEELAETKRAVRDAKAELKSHESEYPTIQAEAAMRYEYGCGLVRQIESEAKRAYLKFLKVNDSGEAGYGNADYPFEFVLEIQPIHGNTRQKTTASVAVLLVAMCSMMASCSKNSPPTYDTGMVILSDISDEQTVSPDTTSLIRFLDLDNHLWGGYFVEMGTIGETDISPTFKHAISSQERYLNNLQKRKREMGTFKESLQESIINIRPAGPTMNRSLIYNKIATSALQLKKIECTQRYILVYSDCMENGPVSFYNKQHWKLLNNNPDSLQNMLMRETPIEDITGITIIFLYKPVSYEDNMRYTLAVQFYERIFEEHGAVVEVQADLNK